MFVNKRKKLYLPYKNTLKIMKILKIIGTILLILLIVVLLVNIFTPSTYKVERSIEINAAPSKVYGIISKFSRFNEWSPWSKKDSAMEVGYEGTDGMLGSIYKWEGNDDVGKGMMQMFELDENKKVAYKMQFGGGHDTNTGYMLLQSEAGNKTNVTWGFTGETSFMFRFFNLLMDNFIGKDFEHGLNKLKVVAEAEPVTNIQSMSFLGGEYLYYKRDKVPFQELEIFFSNAFGLVSGEMQKNGQTPVGPSAGMYFVWNPENGSTDVAAAFPIVPIVEGEMIKQEKVNGVDVYVYATHIATVNMGGYEDAAMYYEALEAWTKTNNRVMTEPALEIYEVSPAETQDSSAWKTRIIYLLK